AGHACVTGYTSSMNFPTVRPLQTHGPGADAFVARLEPDGSALLYSTYLGGSDNEMGEAIAQDAAGSCYVTGWTTSVDFPTVNPAQARSRDAAGVYKSTDGGATWSTHGPDAHGIRALAIDRSNPSTIYAVDARPSGARLYKSADAGESWTAIGSGLTWASIASLAIDPVNSQVLYAATLGTGLIKSSDGGATWSVLDPPKPGPTVYVVSTSLSPYPPVNLYAGIPQSIATSQDGGTTWNNVPIADRLPTVIAADPLNPLVAYAGTRHTSYYQ